MIDFVFILLCIAGAFLGLVVGAMPGLSVTMATAILVSLTYTWQTQHAIALIMGVYVVGVFSGAVSAILVNIPGAPSSVATVLDGYPMAKKGKASLALYTATIYSFLGTVIGFVALWIFATPISKIAMKFSVLDYMLLAVLGLLSAAAVSGKSKVKGIIAAILGLVFSCVGLDGIYGTQRLTFGLNFLKGGISTATALIGLFGMAEILWQLSKNHSTKAVHQRISDKPPLKEILKHWKLGCTSGIIGALVGALPGAGGPVASLIAYSRAQQSCKNTEVSFGEGAIEGVVASESANNACIGGALIPMLTLGVPGDAVTSIILSVFILHGLKPGPFMLQQNPQIFYAIMIGGAIACVAVLVLGITLNKAMSKLLKIDVKKLLPIITLLCVVGVYTASNSIYDIWIMAGFGVLGFAMKKYDYPSAPLVLGLVLGQMCDLNLRRTITIWSAQGGFVSLVLKRPVTIALLILIGIAVYFMIKGNKKNDNSRT